MSDILDSVTNTSPEANLNDADREALHTIETKEWLESLQHVLERAGPERAVELLQDLEAVAKLQGAHIPFSANTPYINTIRVDDEPEYPGDLAMEGRIRAIMRWNAMAMVTRANKNSDGIGGHISSFASSATLYDVGLNHFFRGPETGKDADMVYVQGHSAPGMYSRAYMERRLTVQHLRNFRRELQDEPGLSSYPHPWLMPTFWQFPTVSMGLGPIMSIYQARFNQYLVDRGLQEQNTGRVWAFLGDGEMDEPESLGAITLASRENLDNLIWVINCNLQRLDGPVRGNGKIIQELERTFRGAGWDVVKVCWGSKWDELLEKDTEGHLNKRFLDLVDGESQRYAAYGARELRENFFNTPELKALIDGWSDEKLGSLNRGGHDPIKIYAAYKYAHDNLGKGKPTVILARTVKGYGLGEAGEGKNITHSQKKLNEEEMRYFRDRFNIPVTDAEIAQYPFHKPGEDTAEYKYMMERREALGGGMPARIEQAPPLTTPPESFFEEFYQGSGDREFSTTMAFVNMLRKLLRDKDIGNLIVPIIPDEGRTFGMEALFRQVGIYAHAGQKYEPVDKDNLLYYKEAQDGQILEEGITEAGSMSSFLAAGTAYATHGINTIPFFTYYSMFGFQRIGDQMWLAGDIRCRGFLMGATAGRTTLAGEGLQHQDGHSHVLAYPIPNCKAYDPAFAYELAMIIREGIYRMYELQEAIFYYITIENENYIQPDLPEHLDFEEVRQGVLKGMYKYLPASGEGQPVQLFGSGAILNEVITAQELLKDYGVAATVWNVTSYKELHQDALMVERWNRLHPEDTPKESYVQEMLKDAEGVFVAASDYLKILPDALARHLPRPMLSLGTDGFGRSEAREELRDFFEVDAKHITVAVLYEISLAGELDASVVSQAIKDLGINPEKLNPHKA